ncbi:MAG: threonine synthase [Bacteroidetes bacterium HGW-Bacteroidetes-8]|nr:MAG: threonine synthase [Bacteroidetes bacterium HGW-Bacteroidetes-8]
MKQGVVLKSTISGREYPIEMLEEFSPDGESLEVVQKNSTLPVLRRGRTLYERFAEFLPFETDLHTYSLGEGNTPLIEADDKLKVYTGISNLLLKNETQNPTWSFKDRGSLTCIAMAAEMGERVTATISTGNMGNSIAAYGAKSGIKVVVFVPHYTPQEKVKAIGIHGAKVIKVTAPDYSQMKKKVLSLAGKLNLRIVSGNGPIRVEGYKLTAFELFEQMGGEFSSVPDYIAVPTSACGHIRGIFKGYREMMDAGIIGKLPKMIIVQAANNSPIVSAIAQGLKEIVPFFGFHTIAEAITSGNPQGGDEIVDKSYRYGWLAESVTEEEIIESQRRVAESGYFVEPASATSLCAVKKLRDRGLIEKDANVIIVLTGSGLKDTDAFRYHITDETDIGIEDLNNLAHLGELIGYDFPDETTTKERICNLYKLGRVTGNNRELIKEMVKSFIEIFPGYFNEACEAYNREDLISLRASAHKLKSGISLVVHSKYSSEIIEIEELSKGGIVTSELIVKIESLNDWFPKLVEELKIELERI